MFVFALSGNARSVCLSLLAVAGLLAARPVQAACQTTNATQYSVQVPLQAATFSAGEEFPVGSNIRVQRVQGYSTVTATCTGSNQRVRMSLAGGTLYSGQTNIYQTGIAGLGVRFKNPYENKFYPFETTYLGELNTGGWLAFTIELVKMGPITAGSINTTLFPQVRIEVVDSDNAPVRAAYHTITGSFTLQTPTCVTPNFSWDLGTTSMALLRNKGDASAWVDTPVTLTGCSTFNGNNSNGSYTQYTITGFNTGNASQSGSIAPNTLTMTLAPNTSAVDSANGIVSLDGSATTYGFGVQLGSKQSGSYVAQNLANGLVVQPAVGYSGGTVSFPLAARIIRTSEGGARGGVISTSVTYTVTYQ